MNYSNDSIIKDNNENIIIIIIIIIIIVVVVVVVVVLMTDFDSLGVIWWSIKSERNLRYWKKPDFSEKWLN